MASGLRIVLTGGGSGGHIYPLLAVAQGFKRIAIENNTEFDIRYFGPLDLFSRLMQKEGIEVWRITASKIRRYASARNLLDIPRFFWSIFQALAKLLLVMPDVIFSKGGPGALPVILAGWFYRIPIVIHESDVVPGLVTRSSSWFASKIIVSFERTLADLPKNKTLALGNPIRPELVHERPAKDAAKRAFGFDPAQPLLLVLGGSQGAERINEFIEVNLVELLKITQVLHQTGMDLFSASRAMSEAALGQAAPGERESFHYKPVGYLEGEDLKNALAAADVVAGRAGSGTIFELAAFDKPSILIPLHESANDHQRENAYEFAKTGATVVIEEPNLLPSIFLHQVQIILRDAELQRKMSAAAGAFYRPQVAEKITEEIIKTSLAE